MSSLEIGTVQITGYDFQGSIIFSHINCYNNYDYAFFSLQDLRALLDNGTGLQNPSGILINGRGPNETVFEFQPGEFTYTLLRKLYLFI